MTIPINNDNQPPISLQTESTKVDSPESEPSNTLPFPSSVGDEPLPEMAETGLDEELEYG